MCLVFNNKHTPQLGCAKPLICRGLRFERTLNASLRFGRPNAFGSNGYVYYGVTAITAITAIISLLVLVLVVYIVWVRNSAPVHCGPKQLLNSVLHIPSRHLITIFHMISLISSLLDCWNSSCTDSGFRRCSIYPEQQNSSASSTNL